MVLKNTQLDLKYSGIIYTFDFDGNIFRLSVINLIPCMKVHISGDIVINKFLADEVTAQAIVNLYYMYITYMYYKIRTLGPCGRNFLKRGVKM